MGKTPSAHVPQNSICLLGTKDEISNIGSLYRVVVERRPRTLDASLRNRPTWALKPAIDIDVLELEM